MPLSKQRDESGHNKYTFYFFLPKANLLEFSTNAHRYLDDINLKQVSCTFMFQSHIKLLLKTHSFFSSNKLPNCKAFPVKNQITRELGICKSHVRQGLLQTEPFITQKLDKGLVPAGCGCWDSTTCSLTSAAFSKAWQQVQALLTWCEGVLQTSDFLTIWILCQMLLFLALLLQFISTRKK